MRFGVNALIFYTGALFVRDDGLTMKNLFIALFAIMMAANAAGNNAQWMGDINNAYLAARSLFEILDSEDE